MPDVYELLGVQPIINAAGTITALGGSLMPPEVVAAWNAAARHFVPLAELQDRVGERIAKLLGVEAALVTTGAAGGMQLATAAAVTWRDKSLIARLPLSPAIGIEVVRQKTHRACYDNQVTACGVTLVDVETLDDLERAITPRTAMMLAYNIEEKSGRIAHPEWIAAARRHQVPTLLDAAADTPPRERLWEYNRMGFDLVAFSGGKALRGPQNAGLLLGRKELIEAAKLNTSPNCGTIGRSLKVSKEDMVAMWAAVERFMRIDLDAEVREWRRRIDVIATALREIPALKTETIIPPIANHVPHLLLHWDESRVKITPQQMKARLAAGKPSIATARVHGTGETGFLISVFMLQPGEELIVAERVREILEHAIA
jgi:L-seryl-tRNA(Ser) seleniumtransferase